MTAETGSARSIGDKAGCIPLNFGIWQLSQVAGTMLKSRVVATILNVSDINLHTCVLRRNENNEL
jgi:hypothetical protein